MGVFKEASYFGGDAFFEQLFKHEGICVWNNDDLYSFMQTARQNYWPNGCISTGIQIKNSYSSSYGSYLYLDLRPTWNGNMTYGLYSDSICKNEYDLPDMNVDTITKSLGLLYGSSLQTWNNGLEAFKVCQPCKAYNLKNTYASSNYYGSYSDSSDPNNGYFQCYDDADYTNVNQCMKFRSHAQLEVCTWEDLVTATNQGGILQVKVGDTIFGSERMTKEEYQSLMKSERESNLKWSKAQAQTVAMYRTEAEKIEAMKPTADKWSSLGSTSIAIGAVAILGAVMWVMKRHIDRLFPPKALSEPLLPPSRDFLGKELTSTGNDDDNHQNGAVQTSVPFGNDSDDDDSAIRKAASIDDNTSVSSLSYVSTSPDPAMPQKSAEENDAIAAWYKSVKKIESHESWAESAVKDDVDNDAENIEVIPDTTETAEIEEQIVAVADLSSGDVLDDASDVFDGIDPSPYTPDVDEAMVEADTPVPEVAARTTTAIDALPREDDSKNDESNLTNDEVSIKSIPFLGDVSVTASSQQLHNEGQEPKENFDETEEDIAVVAKEDIVAVAEEDIAVVAEEDTTEPEQDEAHVDVTTTGNVVADEDGDAHSEEETARMSNVSLELVTDEPETATEPYPDEMIQYLSMSASEGEDVIGTEVNEETVVEVVPPERVPSGDVEPTELSTVPAEDGTFDDK